MVCQIFNKNSKWIRALFQILSTLMSTVPSKDHCIKDHIPDHSQSHCPEGPNQNKGKNLAQKVNQDQDRKSLI